MERYGFWIGCEGGEGSGKTTQAKRLVGYLKDEYGQENIVTTKEPGGTPLGVEIRNMLLYQAGLELTATAEALLFAADRAQHVDEVVMPALRMGKIVISDRTIYSSRVYQGIVRGLERKVDLANQIALNGVSPDMVILFDIPVEVGLIRKQIQQENNRFEAEELDFHHKVREGFLSFAEAESAKFIVIDASKSVDEVTAEMIERFCAFEKKYFLRGYE